MIWFILFCYSFLNTILLIWLNSEVLLDTSLICHKHTFSARDGDGSSSAPRVPPGSTWDRLRWTAGTARRMAPEVPAPSIAFAGRCPTSEVADSPSQLRNAPSLAWVAYRRALAGSEGCPFPCWRRPPSTGPFYPRVPVSCGRGCIPRRPATNH